MIRSRKGATGNAREFLHSMRVAGRRAVVHDQPPRQPRGR
jgi:hypothetical protein